MAIAYTHELIHNREKLQDFLESREQTNSLQELLNQLALLYILPAVTVH